MHHLFLQFLVSELIITPWHSLHHPPSLPRLQPADDALSNQITPMQMQKTHFPTLLTLVLFSLSESRSERAQLYQVGHLHEAALSITEVSPAWTMKLDYVISRGPLQPTTFCDSKSTLSHAQFCPNCFFFPWILLLFHWIFLPPHTESGPTQQGCAAAYWWRAALIIQQVKFEFSLLALSRSTKVL